MAIGFLAGTVVGVGFEETLFLADLEVAVVEEAVAVVVIDNVVEVRGVQELEVKDPGPEAMGTLDESVADGCGNVVGDTEADVKFLGLGPYVTLDDGTFDGPADDKTFLEFEAAAL